MTEDNPVPKDPVEGSLVRKDGKALSQGQVPMLRFLALVWPYRWYLLPAFICMLLLGATNGAIAYLVQPILDRLFIAKDETMLYVLPTAVFLVFGARGAADFVQSYLIEFVGQRVVRTLQIKLYNHYLSLDLAFFLSDSTGRFISRVINDTQLLKGAAANAISGLLQEGFSVVVLLGVLIYRDAELALFALITMPAAGYLIFRFGRVIRGLSRTRQEMMEEVTSQLEESFNGLRIVKAFCMESLERACFRRLTKEVLINSLRQARIRALSGPSMDFLAGVAVAGVVIYGGGAIIDGTTTTGTFFSFLTALLLTYNPIKRLTRLNNYIQESMAAADRIYHVLDIEPSIRDQQHAVVCPPMADALCFRGVTFTYGEGLAPVLKEINLTVRAGERVALVGRSGSGKTTLVNLVPRFFDVSSGSITIDGMDIRDITVRSLRSRIAMVTQEVILFNDTVLNNISYGSSDSGMEEVRNAAQAANALPFIEALPKGFATVIGNRGIKLSGGQRQRLSIARSLLRNSPILILDEATSSLDTESEKAVQEALDNLMVGRTTLVIAHRLSTIRNADRIVVLEEGRIVEEGTHESLLENGGIYSQLYAIQFQDQAA